MMANRGRQMQSEGKRRGGRRGSGRQEASWGAQLTNWLDDWLEINPDGTITAFSGKVELGTGVRTALAQIVAEELEVSIERVHMVMGDTQRTPDEGYTAGSMTINSSGTALRNAAAQARLVLLDLASKLFTVNLDELVVQDGVISVIRDPQRKVSYAELMGGKNFDLEIPDNVSVKDSLTYTVVGKSTPREDIPRKVAGQSAFIQDLRVPGMLHGRLVRPPSVGAEFISMDESSLSGVPGVVKVVQRNNFIGIVAEHEEQAIQAVQKLKVEWREQATLPPMQDLYTTLRSSPTQDNLLIDQGDLEIAWRNAFHQLNATYYQPYHAHASIGPSCAVADVNKDQITVWASTPGPYPLSGTLAKLLDVPPEKVHLIHVEGAGSYGQNGSDDAAADAVILSQAVGRPVRLQWSRQDEFVWEPKAPAMVMEVSGGLDALGNVVAWDYQVWSPSHVARAHSPEQLVAGQLLSGQPSTQFGFSFGAERNALTNYSFPNQRVTVHYIADSPLRASSFRSLGGAENTFANESFMDELAAAARVDAVEFRLRYLPDERARQVLKSAASKAGWEARPSPQRMGNKLVQGRGIAFAWYENDQAIVASVAHVQVDTESGAVCVKRIVVAHDCGLIINPDGLRNQIEGSTIQSLSRALKEEVMFDEWRIKSVDWESYPILTFSEVPDVEIVLIDRPDQPALGAGEPSTTTTAAAVANAIFDATGARLRQVPFTPGRVKAALP
ncbi:MAG: molybdopterin cofactor-binding domain-containing protein [Anaerolineales bacterium]|jgi:CO/xanthine dehydrogenase Mo-binding subunit